MTCANTQTPLECPYCLFPILCLPSRAKRDHFTYLFLFKSSLHDDNCSGVAIKGGKFLSSESSFNMAYKTYGAKSFKTVGKLPTQIQVVFTTKILEL